ncbi:FAD-dependent oxidoreductase [Novosphingobium sp.]|uniref:FAD-dependent oxidoreductase n=1 Tax=Novosphingobium sp. TaxID=1874826 RepID=UPI0027332DA8|nr:FAD-dependent oxidoreductase [Novosphingobium sp.]
MTISSDSTPPEAPSSQQQWDGMYDVVVVGSGAAGMTAALVAADLGLTVGLIESCQLLGGTTAVSGGAVWVPANHHMEALSCPDSTAEALTYLHETLGDEYDEAMARAYVETGPALIRHLEATSRLAFRAGPLPDYYSNLPGGKAMYRALDPLPLNARDLGDDIALLRPPHPQTVVFGATFTTGEVATVLRKDKGWIGLVARRLARQYLDLPWLLRRGSSPRLTLGNALIGRLLLSLRDRKVTILTGTALRSLVRTDSRIDGVIAERNGRPLYLHARRGVILAAGGFGANPQMRSAYLTRSPDVVRGVAPADINTGEAIAAGMSIGAATRLMDEAWWIPVYRLDHAKLTCGMFFDRAFPGCIIVNRKGQRFMNDAANYDEAGRAMADAAATPADASYYVFDEHYRRNYLAGPMLPMPRPFDVFLGQDVKRLLVKADSLAELAEKLEIDATGLEAGIARFNRYVSNGVDEDFHRGEERYELHYSDPKVAPNSTLGPIGKPPFYAIAIYPGDIGTKGGLVTNADGQVIAIDGTPIAGLYAAGSSAASMMGRTYPAGGVTIGPAMIFGARAAMHIAGRKLPAPSEKAVSQSREL